MNNQKQLSVEFITKYNLPCFGTQPKLAASFGLQGKQPSYVTKYNHVKSIVWKPFQHFYNLPSDRRRELNNLWQSNPKSGASTLLGFNGEIYIHGVDFDNKNYEGDFSKAIATLFEKFPILKTCHRFSTPSGGLRIIFGSADPPPEYFGANSKFTLAQNSQKSMGEFLTRNGGHTLMPGAVGYTWINCPKEVVILDNPWDIFYPLNRSTDTLQKIKEATMYVDYIDSSFADDYDSWIKIGMALFNESVDLLPEWIKFSKKSNKFSPGECEKKWLTFGKDCLNKVTAGTLHYFAVQSGWKPLEKKVKAKATDNLLSAISNLVTSDLSGAVLEAEMISISKAYSVSIARIESLYNKLINENDKKEDLIDIKDDIQKFLSIMNTDITLEEHLYEPFANPLNQLSKYLGVNKFILLTNLLTVSASLIPMNTRLELYSSSGFYAHPILFSGICAPSGSNKSGGIKLFLDPLQALQKQENAAYKERKAAYDQKKYEWKRNKKEYDPPIEPKPPREYVVIDATSESIARIQNNQPENGFIGVFEELSELLSQANRYRNGKGSDVQKILKSRDGSGIKINRASGLRIDCARTGYSILGGIQPHMLKTMMGDFSDGDGFWARFVWASQFAPIKKPNLRIAPKVDISPYLQNVYRALGKINETFTLTDEAAILYDSWFSDTEDIRYTEVKPAFRSVISKSQRLVGEIALILHCLNASLAGEYPDSAVAGSTMESAIALVKRYIGEIKIIQAAGEKKTKKSLDFSTIINLSKRNGWVSVRDVQRSVWAFRSVKSSKVKEIFIDLEKLGYGATVKKGNSFRWNFNEPNTKMDRDLVDPNSQAFKEVEAMEAREHVSTKQQTEVIKEPEAIEVPVVPVWQENNLKNRSLEISENDVSRRSQLRLDPQKDTGQLSEALDRNQLNGQSRQEEENDFDVRDACTIDEAEGKIIVDESKLDLYREPKLHLAEWKPTRDIVEYAQVRKLYLDIETVGGLDPESGQVVAVGFMFDQQGKTKTKIITGESEKDILEATIAILDSGCADILIGHNLQVFDIPYLVKRCQVNGVRHRFSLLSKSYKTVTSGTFRGKPLDFYEWEYLGVTIMDTFVQACIYDKSAAVLPNYRLKDVAIALGVRDERRLELDHHQIEDYWTADNLEPIKEYLEYDLIDTKGVADCLLPVVWYQRAVVPLLKLQKLAFVSPAKKWQAIAEDNYPYNRDRVAGDRLKFEGAITDCNPGLYKKAYKLDVSSMYPSIIMRYELASSKDPDNYLLRVMKYLTEERLRLKDLYKSTGEETYNHQQGALKILINGGYGFFGTGYYTFNDFKVAALVTAYGRKILTLMRSTLEDMGVTIIEIDTDGIICCGGDSQTSLDKVQSVLPEGINIGLDFTDTTVYVPKRKSYLLFEPSGKVKRVGLFRKRNRISIEAEFTIEYLRLLAEDRQKADEYYESLIRDLRDRKVPISSLSITQRIPTNSKTLVDAGLGNPGDMVTYYYAEVVRHHKKTGKRLKSHSIPATRGDYYVDYYVSVIARLYSEINQIVS